MDELRSAEWGLDQIEPGYLNRVRIAAARLGVTGQGPDLVKDALRDLEDTVQIDVEPPTYASQPGVRAVKSFVKRSIQWYVRYIAVQVNALGQAMVTFGSVVADRLDELEASNRGLQHKVDELTRRFESRDAGEEDTAS